jgi:hypothetical protein
MIKFTDRVCSLDYAKKLKELGVSNETYYIWVREDPAHSFVALPRSVLVIENYPEVFPAYSLTELTLMLPTLGGWFHKSNDGAGKDFWCGNYMKQEFRSASLADVIVKMLIFMITNNAIDIEWINEQLKTK